MLWCVVFELGLTEAYHSKTAAVALAVSLVAVQFNLCYVVHSVFGGSCRACLTHTVLFDNARPLCSGLWSASSTNYAPTPSSASLHFFTLVFLLGMHCLRTFE